MNSCGILSNLWLVFQRNLPFLAGAVCREIGALRFVAPTTIVAFLGLLQVDYLVKLKHGIFDEASMSVINLATISAIGREAGQNLDTRRFRANIVITTDATEPFLEDGWIGGRLVFGDDEVGPMLSMTMRDPRCMMINLDPDTAEQDPRVMKAAVRLNKNHAGAYGTVARTGQISVGQSVGLIIETQV